MEKTSLPKVRDLANTAHYWNNMVLPQVLNFDARIKKLKNSDREMVMVMGAEEDLGMVEMVD